MRDPELSDSQNVEWWSPEAWEGDTELLSKGSALLLKETIAYACAYA